MWGGVEGGSRTDRLPDNGHLKTIGHTSNRLREGREKARTLIIQQSVFINIFSSAPFLCGTNERRVSASAFREVITMIHSLWSSFFTYHIQ